MKNDARVKEACMNKKKKNSEPDTVVIFWTGNPWIDNGIESHKVLNFSFSGLYMPVSSKHHSSFI